MQLQDRLSRGFIAGLIAGLVMYILDYISFFLLHFSKERILEFAAELIYKHHALNFTQAAIAKSAQLLFAGILGMVFAYLIVKQKGRRYLIEGWVYGILVWFAIYALGRQLNVLGDVTIQTALSYTITSSVFGLVLAEMMRWLGQRVET